MRKFLASLIALAYLLAATPAPAGFVVNSFNIAAPPAVSAYIGTNATNDVNVTSITRTAEPIGVAASDRYVVVAVTWRVTATLNSATIGGATATIHQQHSASNEGSAIISLLVPSGTTATIVLNFSTGVYRVTTHVYNINSLVSNANFDAATATGVDPSVNINVDAGGVIIAVACWGSATVGTTWTGVTERYDALNNGSEGTTTGNLDYAAPVTAQQVKANFVAVTSETSLTAVSFR